MIGCLVPLFITETFCCYYYVNVLFQVAKFLQKSQLIKNYCSHIYIVFFTYFFMLLSHLGDSVHDSPTTVALDKIIK